MSFQVKKDGKQTSRLNSQIEPTQPPKRGLKTWFPELSDDTHSKLEIYQEELLKFNKAINLISVSTESRVEAVHFADSILAAKLIFPVLVPQKEIYDFGSGNGFPGLVMSAMFPQFKFILVERDGRKAEFLKHAASKMKLTNVQTIIKTVEDLPDNSCHNVVTRGFASLHKSMLMSRRPMAKDGKLFHLKGDSFTSELVAVPSQLFSHWNASLLGNYTLPETNSVETVVLTEKLTD